MNHEERFNKLIDYLRYITSKLWCANIIPDELFEERQKELNKLKYPEKPYELELIGMQGETGIFQRKEKPKSKFEIGDRVKMYDADMYHIGKVSGIDGEILIITIDNWHIEECKYAHPKQCRRLRKKK